MAMPVLGHNGFIQIVTLLAFGCTRQFKTIKKKITPYTKIEVKGNPYTNVHVYKWRKCLCLAL